MYSTGHDKRVFVWCLETRDPLIVYNTIGKYNQALLIVDKYEVIIVGDDSGNLSKLHFDQSKDYVNKPKTLPRPPRNPLKGYENFREKKIELKGIERLKGLTFD